MEFVVGILCGVLLSLFFSLGPAFFSLIQSSIHHGFHKAVSFAAGVSLSDVVIVLLMLTVLSDLDLNALLHNVYVSIIGGLATGIFGILTYRSKVKSASGAGRLKFSTIDTTHRWQLMLKGFLLNILNPLIWIYWVSIITLLSAEMNLTVSERYFFFLGMLIATFGTDVLKCRLAAMLQTWFTARIMNVFNKMTGVLLLVFSVYLIVSMIIYQRNGGQQKDPALTKTALVQRVHHMVARGDSNDKPADTLNALDTLCVDSLRADSLAVAGTKDSI